MDMKVNSSLVRSERQQRAWSQEHLSKVSGLGLQTIQRIEKTGFASYDSVQALASVFAVDITDLRIDSHIPNRDRISTRRAIFGALSVVLIAAAGLFFGTVGVADQIMLDVDASWRDDGGNDEIRRIGRLLTADGKVAEMRIDNVLRIVVTPTIKDDGRILLTAKIFEFLVDEYVLLADPKLITANKKEAEIRVTADSGRVFRFLITPHAN